MRKALAGDARQFSTQEQTILSQKLSNAEQAFERYVSLAEQGKARDAATLPLYAAGAVLVGDDASGVGVADDVLLPFVGIALLAAYVATLPPPTEREISAAWAGVITSFQALAQAVADVAAQRKTTGCYCRCFMKGIGPQPIGRVPNAAACRDKCKSYPGYECGRPVIFNMKVALGANG